MTWARARALACAALLAMGSGAAQTLLAVNGVPVPGATTALVPGVTYAPAVDLAAALGADVVTDAVARRTTFVLGAAVVQATLVADPAAAVAADPALTRDGALRAGPAGVHDGIEAYVPVKGVVEAFGGRVAFLPESNTVVAVVPRPAFSARLEGRGVTQRLVFRTSGPARVVQVLQEATGVLEVRFERADGRAAAFDGDAFVRATVEPVRGGVEARVQLAPGRTARVLTLPDGAATVVVVAFGATPSPATIVAAQGTKLVLDAGHGGSDAGLTFGVDREADLTRAFVDAVAEALVGSGVEVVRTRPSAVPVALGDRAAAGAGADAFVSVHAAQLPAGQARAYVLDDADAASTLEMAVRRNAEVALQSPQTDALRRALLVRLVPDREAGRRLAEALRRGLGDVGIGLGTPQGAPLAVLAGAGGRGVLLEFAPDDLRDPSLPLTVAAALAEALAVP